LNIVSRAIWKRFDICKPWSSKSWEFELSWFFTIFDFQLSASISWNIFDFHSSANLGVILEFYKGAYLKRIWHLQAPTSISSFQLHSFSRAFSLNHLASFLDSLKDSSKGLSCRSSSKYFCNIEISSNLEIFFRDCFEIDWHL